MIHWLQHVVRGPIPLAILIGGGIAFVAVRLAPGADPAPSVPAIYETRGVFVEQGETNISTELIGAYESASTHHLQIREAVKAHYHRAHDETVTVLSGKGRFVLGDETREVSAGVVLIIPRGVVHSLEVTEGPMEAVSTFSPRFDGADRIYVDE